MHNRISDYLNPSATPQGAACRYEVRLGLARVTVAGNDAQDAIRLARKAFCQELPRMWDVIVGLEESRFAVQVLEQ
jgi:hypothetical protein